MIRTLALLAVLAALMLAATQTGFAQGEAQALMGLPDKGSQAQQEPQDPAACYFNSNHVTFSDRQRGQAGFDYLSCDGGKTLHCVIEYKKSSALSVTGSPHGITQSEQEADVLKQQHPQTDYVWSGSSQGQKWQRKFSRLKKTSYRQDKAVKQK